MPLNFVAKLAITAALTAGQMALQASQRIKGPRLQVSEIGTAENGTPIPRGWGTMKTPPVCIWAEEIRVVTKTSKTKGGKLEQQKAFGTWAELITDMEIDAVRRIWFDEHLVYDASGPGPVVPAGDTGVGLSNIRIYLGTTTQGIDPRYEAWCEDRYGVDSATAFRGSAYVVFEEIPLEKFGNRKPTVMIEWIRNKADTFPYEIKTAPEYGLGLVAFTKDFSKFVTASEQGGADTYAVWDTASRTLLHTGVWPCNAASNFVFNDAGEIYILTGPFSITTVSGDLSSAAPDTVLNYSGGELFYAGGYACVRNLSADTVAQQFADGGVTETDVGFGVQSYFTGPDGYAWALGVVGTDIRLRQLGPDATDLTVPNAAGGTNQPFGLSNSEGNIFLNRGSSVLVIDTSGTVIHSGTVSGTATRETFTNHDGSDTIWFSANEYSTLDCSLLRSESYSSWYSPGASSSLYIPFLNALFGHHALFINEINFLYLDRVNGGSWTLGDIIQEAGGWAGLSGMDTSAQTQPVYEYVVTQGQLKDMISPLLDIHDVDPRQHDFGIQFVNRGGASIQSVAVANMAKESRDDPRYKVAIAQDNSLPVRTTLTFADRNDDHQKNTVISQLPFESTESRREESLDMTTYGATPGEAQQFNDRRFRRLWNERETHEFAVTQQLMKLEGADIITLSLDGLPRTARVKKTTFTGLTKISLDTVRDAAALTDLSTGTGQPLDGKNEETIFVPGPVTGFIVDIPLIRDADNDVNPVLYSGVGGYGVPTAGATIWRGDDGSYDDDYEDVAATDFAVWGLATEALADPPTPWLWDRGNSVEVKVFGTLSSATEAECGADPTLNLVALGADNRWELLQFATATLTGTDGNANVYTLSDLLRGRRGTEWACGLHQTGDVMILASDLLDKEMGADEINSTMSYKAQSFGRSVDSASPIDLTYDGNSLKPYAPERVIWSTDGTDLFGEIIRRTRIGGTFDGEAIPLGETSEAYEIDVYNGSTFKRTISISGTNSFTYTDAEMSTDGLSLIDRPNVNVYQMSSIAGRGFALAA